MVTPPIDQYTPTIAGALTQKYLHHRLIAKKFKKMKIYSLGSSTEAFGHVHAGTDRDQSDNILQLRINC